MVYMLGDEAQPLTYAVDSYLGAARRAQNSVYVYMSKVLGKSVPKSLNVVASKLQKTSLHVPVALRETIVEYWFASGEKLKAYRDLVEHHAIISSDARLVMTSQAKPLIYLTLPNNPEVKTTTLLRYREPVVHAYNYCSESFVELFCFLYKVTYLLARTLGPSKSLTMVVAPRAPLHAGEHPGQEIPSVAELAAHLWAERKRLKALCQGRFGRLDEEPVVNSGAAYH